MEKPYTCQKCGLYMPLGKREHYCITKNIQPKLNISKPPGKFPPKNIWKIKND